MGADGASGCPAAVCPPHPEPSGAFRTSGGGAARPAADVARWQVVAGPGAGWTMRSAKGPDTVRTIYQFEGSGRTGTHHFEASSGAVLAADEAVEIAGGPYGAEALALQGRPIG